MEKGIKILSIALLLTHSIAQAMISDDHRARLEAVSGARAHLETAKAGLEAAQIAVVETERALQNAVDARMKEGEAAKALDNALGKYSSIKSRLENEKMDMQALQALTVELSEVTLALGPLKEAVRLAKEARASLVDESELVILLRRKKDDLANAQTRVVEAEAALQQIGGSRARISR
jgi:hypothetical protein